MTEENDDRAARYSDLFESRRRDHEHAPDCAYCPICATINVVRNTKPEVLDHLAGAVRELLVAAAMLLEEAEGVVGKPQAGRREGSGGDEDGKVRRIDVG
jgi:hypothetical protein